MNGTLPGIIRPTLPTVACRRSSLARATSLWRTRVLSRNVAHLELSVYNLRGQLVATLAQRDFLPGEHRVTFNGSALASGVYLIHLQGEGVSQTSKLLLLK